MRKYLFIFKSELMSNLQYIFNTFSSFITFVMFIFLFQNLWQYIYSDSSSLINGYSMSEMIWYVTITEIIIMASPGKKLVVNISDDVKTGNVAYNINKPYDYIKYQLFSALGSTAIRIIVFLILGILTGYIFIGEFIDINLISITLFLMTCVLSVVVNSLLLIAIGLISFYIEDAAPFYWIYSKFLLVFGVVFPFEFFPKVIQTVLEYSPIYAITYGPAKLFINFSYYEFITVIIIQVVYVVIGYLICNLLYKKGVKKLSVNGG